MRALFLSVMLAGVPFAAAAAPPPDDRRFERQPEDPDGAGLLWISREDPGMVAARQRARAELPRFLRRLANPAAGDSEFAVKFDLAGTREFIWAIDLRIEAGRLTGALGNTPVHRDYRLGERLVIDQAMIVDWGYRRAGRMEGHYTTRVALEEMRPEEAQQVRQAFGW